MTPQEIQDKSLGILSQVWGENSQTIPMIILSGAFVDKQVESLLSHFMIDSESVSQLFHINALLGSSRAKSEVAYALGLIPKPVAQMLWVLGEIRNTVAHSHSPLTFESDELKSLILGSDNPAECLTIPWGYKIHSASGAAMVMGDTGLHDDKDPKEKFQGAVLYLLNALMFLGGQTQREKRRSRFPSDG